MLRTHSNTRVQMPEIASELYQNELRFLQVFFFPDSADGKC